MKNENKNAKKQRRDDEEKVAEEMFKKVVLGVP